MKLIILSLLFSFSINAQTTHDCCPGITSPDEVIKEETISTSCLLCNK